MKDPFFRNLAFGGLLFFFCAGLLVLWGLHTDAEMSVPSSNPALTNGSSPWGLAAIVAAGLGLCGVGVCFLVSIGSALRGNVSTDPAGIAVSTLRQTNVLHEKNDVRLLLGLGGVSALVIGVFLPFVRLPIVGSMNYFSNGEGDGVIVLILAGVSLYAILRRRFRILWGTGLLSAGLTIFTVFRFMNRLAELGGRHGDSELSRSINQMIERSVQLDYGVAVIAIGIVLLLVTAGYRETTPPQEP